MANYGLTAPMSANMRPFTTGPDRGTVIGNLLKKEAAAKAKSTSTSKSTGSSSGVSSGKSFSSIAQEAQSATISAASALDNYMAGAFEQSLDRLMPDWRQQVFGTASQTMSDLTQVTDRFKAILPELMSRTNAVSVQALDQVSSMLRGELPEDVAAELRRTAAEVSQQIGVRGQAAQYLTARDLGLNSLDMIEKGLQYAPTATTMASTAYGQFQNVLSTPMAAAGNLTNMLTSLKAPTSDATSLFANMTSLATNQSQFQTDTTNTNYWNRYNANLGQQAINVSQNQLSAATSFNNQMLDMQREQMKWTQALQTATPVGTVSTEGVS